MTEPDTKIILSQNIKDIKEQILMIKNLAHSININAFHRGLNIIEQDSDSILFALKEINKTLKDL